MPLAPPFVAAPYDKVRVPWSLMEVNGQIPNIFRVKEPRNDAKSRDFGRVNVL